MEMYPYALMHMTGSALFNRFDFPCPTAPQTAGQYECTCATSILLGYCLVPITSLPAFL